MARNANQIQLWFADFPELTLDVRQFSVKERISGLFTVRVTAKSDRHDLPFDNLVDRGAALSLHTGANPKFRVWTGICSHVLHKSTQSDGKSVYELELVPELWRLTMRKNSRIFQERSIPEIVVRILKDWEINHELRNFEESDVALFPKFEYRVQYEETDYAFICRLLEEAGISFYFEFKNEPEGKGRDLTKLILDNEPQLASDPGEKPEDEKAEDEGGPGEKGADDKAGAAKKKTRVLHYRGSHADIEGALTTDDTAVNAAMTRNVRPGRVVYHDHDFRRPPGSPTRATAELEEGSELKYEQFAYQPGFLHKLHDDPESGDKYDAKQANAMAVRELGAVRNGGIIGRFVTNALDAGPGAVVKLAPVTEAAGYLRIDLEARKHLVVESTLRGDTMGPWHMSCRMVPADEPFRPVRETPKPRIHGVQSALVVGDELGTKEEIHCDKHGRVKVQFHWDRQHKYGEPVQGPDITKLASCWVRVSTPWAGAGYGFVAIPRVGHEVLVSFLDGDPDRPVIVGSVYNQFNPPPYTLPKQNTISGLKSSSSPEAGGFNELYFDDAKNHELIHMQAQKNLSTVVKASENRSVGGSRSTRIGKEDTVHVGEQFKVVVGQHETGIWVHENTYVTIQVGGANGAQIMISGSSIYLNAKSDIHLHAGSDIHLSAMGKINIDGGQVHINDGSPEGVELPSYVAAKAPAAGARIDAGTKPKGGGDMPPPPKGLAADVDVKASLPSPLDVAAPSAMPTTALPGLANVPGAPSAAPAAAASAPPGLNRAAAGAAIGAAAALAAGAKPNQVAGGLAGAALGSVLPGPAAQVAQAGIAVATGGNAASVAASLVPGQVGQVVQAGVALKQGANPIGVAAGFIPGPVGAAASAGVAIASGNPSAAIQGAARAFAGGATPPKPAPPPLVATTPPTPSAPPAPPAAAPTTAPTPSDPDPTKGA